MEAAFKCILVLLQLKCTYGFCIDAYLQSNFTPIGVLQLAGPELEDHVELPFPDLLFTEWIFPNSLVFPCSGEVTGWVFRSILVDLDSIGRIPQWTIYRSNPLTVSEQDYVVVTRSGSHEELVSLSPGEYLYFLTSPVVVEAGDILGISYSSEDSGAQFPVLFQRSSLSNAVSYRRVTAASSTIFDVTGSTVTLDTRYMPLISFLTANVTNSLDIPRPTSKTEVLSTIPAHPSSAAAAPSTGPTISSVTPDSGLTSADKGGIAAGIAALTLATIMGVALLALYLLKKKWRNKAVQEEGEVRDTLAKVKVTMNCAYAVTPPSSVYKEKEVIELTPDKADLKSKCQGTGSLSSPLERNAYQKESTIRVSQNRAYDKTPSIPVKTNESYGAVCRSMEDSDHHYSTLDGDSYESAPFEYDYVIT